MGEVEMEVELEVVAAKENDGLSEVVRWEKFLPRMVLRVLLVEADDSTRQIIAALLRKCNYRVMSSSDSISTVLNCMLKGAADFLVKPVRRNELRNLWQHVWRRHMLAGGHLPQNLPVEQPKVEATAENIAESDNSSDYSSSTQKDQERSEKRSDTEDPSCLKTRSVYFSNVVIQRQESDTKMESEPVVTDCQTREKSNGLRTKFLEDDHVLVETRTRNEDIGLQSDRGNVNIISGVQHSNKEQHDCSSAAIDLIGSFDNCLKGSHEHCSFNDRKNKSLFCPLLELSLRRSCPSGSKSQNTSERHTPNHCNASAFSWYNNNKTPQPAFPRPSCKESGLKEYESKHHEDQYLQGTVGVSKPDATGGNSQEKIMAPSTGQSTESELMFSSHQRGLVSVPGARLENGHAVHVIAPVFYAQSGLPPAWSPKLVRQQEHSPFCMSTSVHSNSETHSSGQGCHQSDGTTYTVEQTVHEQNNKEHANTKCGSPVGQSASGSLCNGAMNHDNRSDANCALAAAQKVTVISDSSHYVSNGSKGMDPHRSSQREAALQKFRLKRKDRCFEKKVRYQSRKILAEQRPRVKGQFARQVQNDTAVSDADGRKT